jgi:hypothetical protein
MKAHLFPLALLTVTFMGCAVAPPSAALGDLEFLPAQKITALAELVMVNLIR